jgi:hypothetical protein
MLFIMISPRFCLAFSDVVQMESETSMCTFLYSGIEVQGIPSNDLRKRACQLQCIVCHSEEQVDTSNG